MGKFIVIDGLDGSGKHTQLTRLAEYLEKKGKKVRCVDFPHYHTPGCVLVEEYLSGRFGDSPSDTGAYAASLFYAMDRYYSYKTDWQKDYLDPDTFVLADRYTTANAVHQTSKLDKSEWDKYLAWLFDTEFEKLSLPKPDFVIYLEMLPKLSLELVNSRSLSDNRAKDIHEKDENFFKASYEAAVYAAEKYSWERIRCYTDDEKLRTRDDIFSEIIEETKL